ERGAEAVGAGVPTADDHYVLLVRADRRLRLVAFPHPVRRWEVLHRLVDAGELAARHRQVAPRRRAAREHDRIAAADLAHRDVAAHVGADPERGSLGAHLLDALLEVPLLHLELGNAVAAEAAEAVGALVNGAVVAGP